LIQSPFNSKVSIAHPIKNSLAPVETDQTALQPFKSCQKEFGVHVYDTETPVPLLLRYIEE
jgi:hypothetical protein